MRTGLGGQCDGYALEGHFFGVSKAFFRSDGTHCPPSAHLRKLSKNGLKILARDGRHGFGKSAEHNITIILRGHFVSDASVGRSPLAREFGKTIRRILTMGEGYGIVEDRKRGVPWQFMRCGSIPCGRPIPRRSATRSRPPSISVGLPTRSPRFISIAAPISTRLAGTSATSRNMPRTAIRSTFRTSPRNI